MMSKVVALMSMSLDGYVADANDGVAEVFDWYFSGDVEVPTASTRSGMTFHVSAPSADHLRGLTAEVGAMLTGRRTFEVADGWGGQHPWDIPALVATHHVPDGWPRPGSTVQFVTDGIESAVAQAKSGGGIPGKAYEPDGWELWAPLRPLYEAGEYAEVADRLRGLVEADPQYAELFYNLVCCESLAGRTADAVDHLRRAIDMSERFRAYAKDDSDFDPIRDEPAFKELIGR